MMREIDPRAREKGILLGVVLLAGVLLLIGRLFQMQVLGAEEYTAKADENRIRPERLTALRGRIYDRTGLILADSRPSFSVSVIPYQIKRDPEVLNRLGALIDVEPEELRERVRRGYSRPYEPRVVVRDVDIRTVSIVEERTRELPGVLIASEPVRRYPQGERFAHLLGYLGEVSERELREAATSGSGLGAGSRVGRTGLEKQYDRRLRGKDGVRYVQEDARGRTLGTLRESAPVPGEDLRLTVDGSLQALSESLLKNYMAGAVVALDPRTGDILVLSSWPSFDPNLFAVSVSSADWDSLTGHKQHPLLNRTTQAAYPPGSVFKLITSLTGLMEGLVKPETRLLPCLGSYRFGRRVFRCWKEEGHGSLPLRDALARSCDVYYYQIGSNMDLDRFSGVAGDFGFGKKTGVDLPTERSGLVPSKKYMNDRYGRSGWGPGFKLNHSIGQGEILTTPLQIARYFGAIATGSIVRPRLLKESIDPDGNRIDGPESVARAVSYTADLLDPVRLGIIEVVEGLRGTGGAARVPGIRVAGKTGTAQNPHGLEHAWFVAYAPAEQPEIVVCVFLEQAGHGGSEAAPIAGDLLRLYFSRKRGA